MVKESLLLRLDNRRDSRLDAMSLDIIAYLFTHNHQAIATRKAYTLAPE